MGLWTKTDQPSRQSSCLQSEMRTTVKICFVMDCTQSMGPWMQAAKNHIQELIYSARETYSDAAFDVAFVGYRDYGSREQHIVYDFMGSEELVRAIRPILPTGGDDDAEDVAWGLFHASKLSWTNADVCLVYHIADAPAHGDLFTGRRVSDRFPEGDPNFLDPRQIIKEWSQQGYHYTFLRVTRSTDTMIDQFYTAWCAGGTFRVIDLIQQGPRGFLDAVRDSVNETLTQYTASQDPVEGSDSPKQLSYSSR